MTIYIEVNIKAINTFTNKLLSCHSGPRTNLRSNTFTTSINTKIIK
ncbi:Uncharacterised protein [uncultured Bacteroides sp.]|nr:Uncharacterised protein [uncultured Bacteroides sp.]